MDLDLHMKKLKHLTLVYNDFYGNRYRTSTPPHYNNIIYINKTTDSDL